MNGYPDERTKGRIRLAGGSLQGPSESPAGGAERVTGRRRFLASVRASGGCGVEGLVEPCRLRVRRHLSRFQTLWAPWGPRSSKGDAVGP